MLELVFAVSLAAVANTLAQAAALHPLLLLPLLLASGLALAVGEGHWRHDR